MKYRGTFVCAVNAELRLARSGSSSDIFVKPHGAGAAAATAGVKKRPPAR